MDLRTCCTLLFTPANRPERFDKAKQVNTDGLIIDLEDSVPLSQKDSARGIALNFLKHYQADPSFLCCLRINSIKTPSGLKDITALIENKIRPDVLVIPKTEYAAEIVILDNLLHPLDVAYLPMIETAVGLDNAYDIAAASPHVQGLIFGGADLAADLNAQFTWEPMLNARSIVVRAAASRGIAAMDVPYLNLKDADDTALVEETKRIIALGYTGKLCIHPKHAPSIKAAFSPTEDEIKKAQRIVDLYEKAGQEVCEIDNKMIDMPVYKSAKRILSLK